MYVKNTVDDYAKESLVKEWSSHYQVVILNLQLINSFMKCRLGHAIFYQS